MLEVTAKGSTYYFVKGGALRARKGGMAPIVLLVELISEVCVWWNSYLRKSHIPQSQWDYRGTPKIPVNCRTCYTPRTEIATEVRLGNIVHTTRTAAKIVVPVLSSTGIAGEVSVE